MKISKRLKRYADSKKISSRVFKSSKREKIFPTVANLKAIEHIKVNSVESIPISLVRIETSEIDNVKRITLQDSMHRGNNTARIYIAKGSEIIKLIDHTNSEIKELHKKGKIDLSGKAF